MTHVRFDNVQLPEARGLTFKGETSALVTAVSGEVLYGSIRRESGMVLVLAVNLDEGDLPFRTAFPILFTNAVSHLTGGKDDLRPSLSAGEVTTVTASELGPSLRSRHLQTSTRPPCRRDPCWSRRVVFAKSFRTE